MARTLTAVPLALLLLLATATGAFAHVAFREREVPAQSEQTLTLLVADERPGETTVAVEVLVPRPFEVLDCPSDTEWTCEVGTDEQGRTILSWSRERGEGDAALTIDVRTPDEAGNSRWLTVQTYDSGTEVAWNQRSEERPAPLLIVAEPGAPVVEATDEPADHGNEVEGEEIVPTDTLPPTEPAATDFTPPVEPTEDLAGTAPAQPEATESPTPPGDPGDEGGIGLWGVVALLLILAAGLGAARMVRRGPAGGVPGGATEDPYDPEG